MTKKQIIPTLADLPVQEIAKRVEAHPEYVRYILRCNKIPPYKPPMKRDSIRKMLDLQDNEIVKRSGATKTYVQAIRRAKEDNPKYFRHSKNIF